MIRRISRRTILRGAGVALALPWLEAASPRLARGADPSPARLLTFFIPNGMPLEFLTPTTIGADFETTDLLAPLAAHRDQTIVVSGVTGVPNGHPGGICGFATGVPGTFLGAGGPSVERVASQLSAGASPYPALAVAVRASGTWSVDGYSSACFTYSAWDGYESPAPTERDPQAFFTRLFGDGTPQTALEAQRRAAYRHSVLDSVKADLARLNASVGAEDRIRLEKHLDAVRDVEQRIDLSFTCMVPEPPSDVPPGNAPAGYYRRVRLQLDILALAVTCGLTRYASFMLCDGSSDGGPDTEAGIPGQQHELFHAGDRQGVRAFTAVHMQHLAYLLDRLADAEDGDGSVLDNALVFAGTELSDGTIHSTGNHTFLLLGGAGGGAGSARHIAANGETSASLLLSCLRLTGHDVAEFAGTSAGATGL